MPAPKRPSEQVLEYIRTHFRYDPISGILKRYHKQDKTWRIVKLNRKYDANSGHFSNPVVGIVNETGIQIKLSVTNICWYLQTGSWPERQVDHIHRNCKDNRFKHLRLSTERLQKINRRKQSDLLPGVRKTKSSRRNPFCASVTINGHPKFLGMFPTEIAAHEAYRRAYKEIEGEELDYPYLEWVAPQVVELKPEEITQDEIGGMKEYIPGKGFNIDMDLKFPW